MIRRLYLFVVFGPWASLGSFGIPLYELFGLAYILFCIMVALWVLHQAFYVGVYIPVALRVSTYKEIAEAHIRVAVEYIDERSIYHYVRIRYGVSRPKKWIPVYPGGVC